VIESATERFQEAIQATHGARAELVAKVAVREQFHGEPLWEQDVLVFDLLDHPTASRAYAWATDDGITVVLHTGPIDSPAQAVRASIAAALEEG
jgi:hypothetical protein